MTVKCLKRATVCSIHGILQPCHFVSSSRIPERSQTALYGADFQQLDRNFIFDGGRVPSKSS